MKKSNPFAKFKGTESKKEEKAEKKMPPWMYKKGEKMEPGEKMKKGGKVRGKC